MFSLGEYDLDGLLSFVLRTLTVNIKTNHLKALQEHTIGAVQGNVILKPSLKHV